jgi:uncharacterized membrane protein
MPFKLGLMELIILLFLIPLYFLPLIIAVARHHSNVLGIFLLNLFLGWTFLGWIGALVWSVLNFEQPAPMQTAVKKNTNALAIAEERFARGEIISEEFDRIRSRLS